jgi:thiol:disulfide interchange protein DsbD
MPGKTIGITLRSLRPGLAASLLLSSASALASPPRPPVSWQIKTAPARPVKPGAKFAITVAGSIDPGWHVYALEEPQGGPIATEVALTEGDPADLLRVDESKPEQVLDPLFGLTTGFFKQSVEFRLNLQIAPGTAAGPRPLHVLIRYQSCNDRVCLPPHTDTLEVPVAVAR